MNPNAAPFFPSNYEKEERMMDEIEKNFLRQNRWLFNPEMENLFEYKEYKSEKAFNLMQRKTKVMKQLPLILE